MSITRPESGLTLQTSKDLGLDVGLGIVNGNLLELFDVVDPSTVVDRMRTTPWEDPLGVEQTPFKIGTTKGGIEYNPGLTQRQVEFDGRRSAVKGLWRIDNIEPTLKMSILQIRDPDLMQKYLGAADRTRVGYYERMKQRLVVDDELDYWWNIVWIQFVSGQPLPILYILQNPHVSANESINLTDKSEAVLPVTFTGNTTEDDPYGDTFAPGEIWVPSQYNS